MTHPFFFATGIENSYPTLVGGKRIDQMEKCGHYERWEQDFGLVRDLGIRALRYGPPYYRVHTAPDRFDWSVSDDPMHRLRDLGIEVFADLCHFGAPSRSEEHTSELQSRLHLVCRLLLEKKKNHI